MVLSKYCLSFYDAFGLLPIYNFVWLFGLQLDFELVPY